MKNLLLRSFCLGCFLLVLNFGKAQPIITEYFTMKESVKIDLNDKKLQKSITGKGILDIVWNTSNSVLAITYDPKAIESKEVVKTIQDILATNNVSSVNHPTNTK